MNIKEQAGVMYARDKVSVGRYVKLTPVGIKHFAKSRGAHKADTRGRVVGFGANPRHVQVLRDGVKTPMTYHMDFWETCPEQVNLPLPHNLNASEGPACSCGRPSTHESGWCGDANEHR
jgi:hypothetical protein